jgi:hypothetical protein
VDDTHRDRFDYSVGGEFRATALDAYLFDQLARLHVSGDDIHSFQIVPGIKLNPYEDVVSNRNAIFPSIATVTTDWTPNGTADVSFHF